VNPAIPRIELLNRQRGIPLDFDLIRSVTRAAAGACLEAAKPGSPLTGLAAVEISFLSDAAITRVHGRFFGDPTPTDVITFPYGEILIGAGTVAAHAPRFFHSASMEASLCAIHGLLHLGGHDDLTKQDAAAMARLQERLLKAALKMVA